MTVYIAGARARLQREVDPKPLRQWVLGMLPDAPQKEGAPVRFPNGETIGATQEFPVLGDENGGFMLFSVYFPTNLVMPLHGPVGFRAIYDPVATNRYAEIGSFGRFGLTLVVGPTNFVYVPDKLHFEAVKWADGMYVFAQGGG